MPDYDYDLGYSIGVGKGWEAGAAAERAKLLDELADEDVREYVAMAAETYWEDDINEDGDLTEEEFEYRRLRVKKFLSVLRGDDA